jgi:hypothetical protein
MSTSFPLAKNQVMQAARVVQTSNLAGSYSNGPTNNGVGATLTKTSAGALTIDSVAVENGDRVLLVGQTNGNENGLYIVINAGSASVAWVLQRTNDCQCAEQLVLGYFVPVYAGTVNGGAMYQVVEPLPANFGIDDIAFNGVITSGLGNAATKGVTDNTKADVASVDGSFVAGNFPMAADTAGTIEDSGFNVDNILRVASVAITAAEFNGMYATPKLLIAAPGANKQIIVDQMELIMTFGAAQFAAGGVVAAQYDSTAHGAGVLATATEAAADFTGAAASTTFRSFGSTAVAPFTTTVNKGIYLSNQTAAFTTGDSDFVAKVHYRIVATA